jgi:DNA/RNA endonuclease YhcR with UshA esterase domain
MVLIDWSREDPLLRLEIHDDEGDALLSYKVPLSLLKYTATATQKDLAAEARKHVDKEWEVEFTVQASGTNRGKTLAFLNSEENFRGERTLTVVLDLKALEKELAAAKIVDPARHYAGKKIRVKGVVSLFNMRPQIVVKKLDQIQPGK